VEWLPSRTSLCVGGRNWENEIGSGKLPLPQKPGSGQISSKELAGLDITQLIVVLRGKQGGLQKKVVELKKEKRQKNRAIPVEEEVSSRLIHAK